MANEFYFFPTISKPVHIKIGDGSTVYCNLDFDHYETIGDTTNFYNQQNEKVASLINNEGEIKW